MPCDGGHLEVGCMALEMSLEITLEISLDLFLCSTFMYR